MSDVNPLEQAGNFSMDAVADTTADNLLNPVIDSLASHIPGGDTVDQMLKTEVDQVVNNAINNELNKGVSGMVQDVEGLFGGGR